jgi:F-type H+-transporting ATPase subunit a
MAKEAYFSWFHYIPGLSLLPGHVAAAAFISILLCVFAVCARLSLARHKDYLVPPSRLSFLNFADVLSESLYKLTQMVLNHDAKEFLPVIGALFLYVFFNNLLGIFPGFSPATDNINTTLACGIFVFLYYNYRGFKASGWAYMKHFFGPVWYMAWLLLPIELISHFVRPFTLALRLKGNMAGDHTVLAEFTNMAPYLVPVPVYFLGLLVCFLQAFIFVMLSMVYISMAKESDHH